MSADSRVWSFEGLLAGLRDEIARRQIGSVVCVSFVGSAADGGEFHFHVGCVNGIGEDLVPPQWEGFEVYTFAVEGDRRRARAMMLRECVRCLGGVDHLELSGPSEAVQR